MKEFKRIVRFKNNVSQEIVDFVKAQTNFSETVTYLIEKEIHENGIRNLVNYIPIIRTEDYFDKMLGKGKSNIREVIQIVEHKEEPKPKKRLSSEKPNSILDEYDD